MWKREVGNEVVGVDQKKKNWDSRPPEGGGGVCPAMENSRLFFKDFFFHPSLTRATPSLSPLLVFIRSLELRLYTLDLDFGLGLGLGLWQSLWPEVLKLVPHEGAGLVNMDVVIVLRLVNIPQQPLHVAHMFTWQHHYECYPGIILNKNLFLSRVLIPDTVHLLRSDLRLSHLDSSEVDVNAEVSTTLSTTVRTLSGAVELWLYSEAMVMSSVQVMRVGLKIFLK